MTQENFLIDRNFQQTKSTIKYYNQGYYCNKKSFFDWSLIF